MESILRAAAVYLFLLVIVRLAGRRTLGELDTFDFVLLLIISETCQEALIGEDYSIMGAWISIASLIGLDILLAFVKSRSSKVHKWLEGVPSLLIEDGKVLLDELERAKIDEDDIRECARKQLGLSKLSHIRHAVLEKDGSISVIPWERVYSVSPGRTDSTSSESPLAAQ